MRNNTEDPGPGDSEYPDESAPMRAAYRSPRTVSGAGESVFGSVAEYYNIPTRAIWRTGTKGSKNLQKGDPFDLSPCIERSCTIWKSNWLLGDLGLTDESLNVDRTAPFSGLVNMGATCYINTLIQSLYMNADFRNLILSLPPGSDTELNSLQALFAELRYSNLAQVSPLAFLEKFSIKLNLQEDATEFSTLFLNWLDERVGGRRICRLFEGEIEHTTTCTQCNHSSVTRERFLEIRLDITGPKTLQSLLDESFNAEDLIEGYRCSGACGITLAVRRTRIAKLPKYLRVVLNRYKYSWEGGREKLSFPVSVPLRGLVVKAGQMTVEYTCDGLLEHHSNVASSGHYTAFLREGTDWWLFDDAFVAKVEPSPSTPGKGRKSIRSNWTESRCESGAVYMAIFHCDQGESGPDSPPNEFVVREAEMRNEVVKTELEAKRNVSDRIRSTIQARRDVVDQLSDQSVDPSFPLTAVSAAALKAWFRGDDIRCRFIPSTSVETYSPSPPTCPHNLVSPIPIRAGLVKLVPSLISAELDSSLPVFHTCRQCVSDIESQITVGFEFYDKLNALVAATFDSVTHSFGTHPGPPVWVCKSEMPKIGLALKNAFASRAAVLAKICASDGTEHAVVETDITRGVACVHGRLVPDAHTDGNLVLKPRTLVTDLVRMSEKDSSLIPILPRIKAETLIPLEDDSKCADCVKEERYRDGALTDSLAELQAIVDAPPLAEAKHLIAGERFYILPSTWFDRIKRWRAGRRLAELSLDTLICSHGDLKLDVLHVFTSCEGDMAKIRKLPFRIVGESEINYYFSNVFRTMVGLAVVTERPAIPVIERDRTYSIGTCPIVCEICSDDATTARPMMVVSVRVFHEPLESLEGPSKTVRVSLNETTVLYRPGRSRLVGSTKGLDRDSTGLDAKLMLVDIGILDQSPFPISVEDAVTRMNVFVHHPSVRGSLVMLKDEVGLGELMERFGNSGIATDTVFVEFVGSDGDLVPVKKRKKHTSDDRDAGLQGSILRS